jgi:membrane protein
MTPLAAVLGLVVARLSEYHPTVASGVMSAVPKSMEDFVTAELERVAAWNNGSVAPIAAGTFVLMASNGVHAVFDGLEVASHARPRPWWRKRLLAIVTCIALSIAYAAVTLLGGALAWVYQIDVRQLSVGFAGGIFGAVASMLIAFGVHVVLVAALYSIGIPRRGRPRPVLLPGALCAAILQSLFAFGYGVYLRHMGNGGAYLAGIAAIGVTMILLYLFSLALLTGAALDAILGEHRTERRHPPSPQVEPPRRISHA